MFVGYSLDQRECREWLSWARGYVC